MQPLSCVSFFFFFMKLLSLLYLVKEYEACVTDFAFKAKV